MGVQRDSCYVRSLHLHLATDERVRDCHFSTDYTGFLELPDLLNIPKRASKVKLTVMYSMTCEELPIVENCGTRLRPNPAQRVIPVIPFLVEFERIRDTLETGA
jgi:hypothetical protein